MRVAFLTTEYGDLGRHRGGLGSYLSRTAPLLAAAGAECHVYLCSGQPGDQLRGTVERDGVAVHHVPGDGATPFDGLDLPNQVRWHLRSAWLLADALASSPAPTPEVVQVPNFGVSGLFVDVCAPMIMRFSSHAATWHAASGARRDARTVLGEILQRRAIDRATAHYAPSRFVAKLVFEETGIPVDVIRPPAPTSMVGRSEWESEYAEATAGDVPYVVHAGQLGRAKGTDLVVAAAEMLLHERSDIGFHFCGADAGAGTLITALERRFPGRVKYHGRLPANRLLPLMHGARAVLCPSRADNLPNVAIEAMVVGTPVIGTHGASIDELVEDGVSGILVPLEPTALATAIARVVELSEVDLRRMQQAACSRISTVLDPGRQIDALLEYYRAALRRPVAEPRPRSVAARLVLADLQVLRQCWDRGRSASARRSRVVRKLARWFRAEPVESTGDQP